MGYQIDSDTAPPIIGAVLTVAVGSLQELTLTVPRSYYDGLAAEPEYIYAGGYGGKVESIALSDAQAVISAKSHAGGNIVDYLRINPSADEYAAETVSGWLSNLTAGANGTAAFSGDGAILGSRPLTVGLAVGEFFSTLCQLAGCFGLDVVHTAADAGDVYKFIHAAVTAGGAVNAVLSLSVQGSKPAYDYAGIVKTAPIDQRDTCTISAERRNNPYGINYTSQGHPYLEGTWNPEPIRVYWRDWTLDGGMRLSPDDFAKYDKQLKLMDEDYEDDPDYKDAFGYAPFFGQLLETWRNTETIGGNCVTYHQSVEGTLYHRFGVWPNNVPWNKSYWERHYEHYRRPADASAQVPPAFDPSQPYAPNNPNDYPGLTVENNNGSLLHEEDEELYEQYPYSFGHEFLDETSTGYRADYGVIDTNGTEGLTSYEAAHSKDWFEDKYEAGSDISKGGCPWLPVAREVVSCNNVVTRDGSSETTVQEITVSKALFDADFDDVHHPATIDPDPPVDIHLDKHSETWFDPTASPAANCQFMGFGLTANIKYQMGWNSQYIMMRINGGAGAATARWDNGSKVQRYNAADWYLAEIPDGSSGSVKHTLISSNSRSFSTVNGTEEGEGYIVSGTVWSSKAIAAVCVPHILRQQNRTEQVNFSVPLSVSALDAVVDMVGAAVSVGGHTVYITSVSCDFASETAAFAGCVLAV